MHKSGAFCETQDVIVHLFLWDQAARQREREICKRCRFSRVSCTRMCTQCVHQTEFQLNALRCKTKVWFLLPETTLKRKKRNWQRQNIKGRKRKKKTKHMSHINLMDKLPTPSYPQPQLNLSTDKSNRA